MADRACHEKDVALPNGLKVHYDEWPGPRPDLVLLHPSSGYGRMHARRPHASGVVTLMMEIP